MPTSTRTTTEPKSTACTTSISSETPTRRGPGRPKGSKNKPVRSSVPAGRISKRSRRGARAAASTPMMKMETVGDDSEDALGPVCASNRNTARRSDARLQARVIPACRGYDPDVAVRIMQPAARDVRPARPPAWATLHAHSQLRNLPDMSYQPADAPAMVTPDARAAKADFARTLQAHRRLLTHILTSDQAILNRRLILLRELHPYSRLTAEQAVRKNALEGDVRALCARRGVLVGRAALVSGVLRGLVGCGGGGGGVRMR